MVDSMAAPKVAMKVERRAVQTAAKLDLPSAATKVAHSAARRVATMADQLATPRADW